MSSEHGTDSRPTATILDVAKLAGVSPSTVSRALSIPGRVAESTAVRVRAAAAELGYFPNPAAKALLSGRTRTIGLVLADITNPVVFGIIRGAGRACARAGYTLVISESQVSGTPEAELAAKLLPGVDGLILGFTWLLDEEIEKLAALRPLALVNRTMPGVQGVVPDLDPGVHELIDHLAEQGRTVIAYVSGPPASWMNRRRWESVYRAARERGLSIFEIPTDDPSIDGGRAAYERIAASPAAAVIAYNDLLAIGIMQAAQEAGLDVPRDLSIVGFDDIFGAALTTPGLTTVAAPLEQMAERAVALLLGDPAPSPPFPTTLVRRGSG